MAYYTLLEAQFAEANEKGKGMARTITLATITMKKFDEVTSHVNLIGGGYKQNWTAKRENVKKIKD